MAWTLFHQIGDGGGADSAIVRKYVVDHNLKERIEFLNVAYEGAQKTLRELIGHIEAPVLVADGRVIRGSAAIIDFLSHQMTR